MPEFVYDEALLLSPRVEVVRNAVSRFGLESVANYAPNQQAWAPQAMTATVPAWAWVFAREYKSVWGPSVLTGYVLASTDWDTLVAATNRYVDWHIAHGRAAEAVSGVQALAVCAYFKPHAEGSLHVLESWTNGAAKMQASVAQTLDLWNAYRWSLED